MKKMNLIAAVDRNWSIGKGSELLVSIPKDRKLFMDETLGKTVVMGRNTFLSLPGQQPLYGRRNIVLSGNAGFAPKGVLTVRSLQEALDALQDTPEEDIYVIGGEQIYRLFLPYCSTAHITRIDYAYDGDRYFPDLDADPDWELAEEGEEETYFDVIYSFCRYTRRNPPRNRL